MLITFQEVDVIIVSNLIFLQITKLRPREVKSLIEGHTAAKEGSNLC